MQKHYKGEITIEVDSWGDDEYDAIDNYLWQLGTKKNEKANVLDYDLECVEEDDTDDEDYYRDIEFDNWREREDEL